MSILQNRKFSSSWVKARASLLSLLFFAFFLSFSLEAQAQTVTADYAKAKSLFDKGDQKGAGRILLKLLKKYPDHQPSSILLGRVYYNLGQPTKAAKAFSRVSPDAIPNDTAFEYGAAMFASNQCSNAVQGFSKVTERSGLRGIADFYIGVCYMKKKQWHKAGNFLRRAKKLPPSLVSSRRKLLRSLDDREKEERQGQIGQPYQMLPSLPPPPGPSTMPYYSGMPPGPEGGPPADVAKSDPKKDAKKPPAPAPKLGFSFSATPAFTYIGLQKSDENHGYKSSETTGTSKEYTLGMLVRYDGSPRDFGGQPAFTLPVNIGRYSSAVKTKSTKLSAFDDAPDTVFTEVVEAEGASITTSTDGGASSRTYATGESWEYTLLPTGFIPLTESIDLEFKYLYKEVYPHMHAALKSGAKGPSGKAIIEFAPATVSISVGSTDSVNAKGDAVRNDLSIGGDVSKTWETLSGKLTYSNLDSVVPGENPKLGAKGVSAFGATLTKNFEKLSLTGTVKQTTLLPWDGLPLAGAASSMRAELNGKMSFDLFSVSATGALTQFSTYQALGLEHPTAVDGDGKPQKVTVAADGSTTSGVGVLKATPFDWLWGAVVYSTSASEYSVKDQEMVAKFKAATLNQTSQFTYALGVSKSF